MKCLIYYMRCVSLSIDINECKECSPTLVVNNRLGSALRSLSRECDEVFDLQI